MAACRAKSWWLKPCFQSAILFKLLKHIHLSLWQTAIYLGMASLLVLPIKNHLSSFELDFLNIFCAKTCCVVLSPYCFCYSATNKAQKMSTKPRSIRLLRWFDFSQSENGKNNRKTFKRASVESTNHVLYHSFNIGIIHSFNFNDSIYDHDIDNEEELVTFPNR